jgi:hypothetical protein
MATVRIYKVAELLNTSSQEVIALLKRDHGIEVKSASSGSLGNATSVCRRTRRSPTRRSPPGAGDRQPRHQSR